MLQVFIYLFELKFKGNGGGAKIFMTRFKRLWFPLQIFMKNISFSQQDHAHHNGDQNPLQFISKQIGKDGPRLIEITFLSGIRVCSLLSQSSSKVVSRKLRRFSQFVVLH